MAPGREGTQARRLLQATSGRQKEGGERGAGLPVAGGERRATGGLVLRVGVDVVRISEAESAELTGAIIGAAIEVHRALGPGMLESAYEEALCHELGLRGLTLERGVHVPLRYKGAELAVAYVADVIVGGAVVLELKAVEHVHPVHKRQLLTYLRLTGCRYGLLLNFGAERMVDGITRLVDG